MLILNPTAGNKTISIAPRSADVDGTIVLILRRDGEGTEESITPVSLTKITNFTEIVFTPTILKEDATYYLEITRNGKLWYRDKIYVTSQTALERTTEKHVIGNNTIYQTYNSTDDNTYII